MGPHAAASLGGLSDLPVFGRDIVVLYRNAAAEEAGRAGAAANVLPVRSAQLKTVTSLVMAGLVPAIHVFLTTSKKKDVDARHI
jgi:hypothetical protein